MNIIGIKDSDVKLVKCPICGKQLMYVNNKANGIIYPYCKACKRNVKVVC